MNPATPMDIPLPFDVSSLNFEKGGGLVTVVAQDADTGVVLMVAHANHDAIVKSVQTGEMHYTSRTRGLWHKGATSGNVQRVVSLTADCDADAVLARVRPAGPTCHNGTTSCFRDEALGPDALRILSNTIARRAETVSDTSPSYTHKLLSDRNTRLKKLGEEATELAVACADNDADRAKNEAADLVFHVLVALRAVGVSLADVQQLLAGRVDAPRR